MIRYGLLPKKYLIILHALIILSEHGKGKAVRGKVLSEHVQTSERYLEPMLQQLVHHQILRGVRGPKGGYVLAVERRKITLWNLYTILCEGQETPEKVTSPVLDVIDTIHHQAIEHVQRYLETLTLEDVYQQQEKSTSSDEDIPSDHFII